MSLRLDVSAQCNDCAQKMYDGDTCICGECAAERSSEGSVHALRKWISANRHDITMTESELLERVADCMASPRQVFVRP